MVFIAMQETVLVRGLELVGYNECRQANVAKTTNIKLFVENYGSHPSVYAAIFNDLQTTDVAEARITGKEVSLDYFLMAIHYLKCNGTEGQRAGPFRVCKETLRTWSWFYIQKIQALKKAKVRELSFGCWIEC